MPTICIFYGIRIMIHLGNKEHNPPHIHALYGRKVASFSIKEARILEGDFPDKGKKLVIEFINKYSEDLLEMWNSGNYRKLPPLD